MLKSSLSLLFALILFACNNVAEKENPVTDTDVATAFIRNLLDNKCKDAAQYMLDEETNHQYLDMVAQKMRTYSKQELEGYKKADIIINEISNVSDSISIINYSNSYKKENKNKVKLIRQNGKWLVDFKYTFSGNM